LRGLLAATDVSMLRRLAGGLDQAAALLCCGLVIALLGCVSLGVVTRSFGDPLIWTDELSRFLMVWLAVFGWIVASRKRIHVRIRYFQERLPSRVQPPLELALQFAVALFGALVCVYSVVLVIKNRDLHATSLPISMAWMYVPMVLAGFVTAAQGTRDGVDVLLRRGRAIVDDSAAKVE
jgi:TRAP-type C4-dicarboxylate transport system permease small subunit